jgi:hypothetical protein
MLSEALNHLQSAIELLDRAGAPGHIAAHVDLAARQLEDLLSASKGKLRPTQAGREGCGAIPTSWPLPRG